MLVGNKHGDGGSKERRQCLIVVASGDKKNRVSCAAFAAVRGATVAVHYSGR